ATRNKAEEIAEINRLDSIRKFEFDDLRVSGNDDVAFATFLATVHFQTNGQDSTEQYRYTVNFIAKDVPITKGEHQLFKQASCSRCHSETGLRNMLVRMNEKGEIAKEMAMAIVKSGSDESLQDKVNNSFKHTDVIRLHQRQLK